MGRYLHTLFGGIGWTRETTVAEGRRLREAGVDVIVHCAYPAPGRVASNRLGDYVEDSVQYTRWLATIPHDLFVFISSVDVYPKDGTLHQENEEIAVDAVEGLYGVTKLMCEAVVGREAGPHLVLRAGALLGPHARRNSVMRILHDDPCRLTLAAESTFNCLHHRHVGGFIARALELRCRGIYNLVSGAPVTLGEVATEFGRSVAFGTYRYDAGSIDNREAAAVFPLLPATSMDVIREFAATPYQETAT